MLPLSKFLGVYYPSLGLFFKSVEEVFFTSNTLILFVYKAELPLGDNNN